ncbi:hypothetical protein H8356DRAFT_1339311 [Neocallimastix lanati (nom. inval.)]|nr:hypothetical protein H8356DRAFT_1339311 [Neocallimastix sp. JGI-2020a]
MIPIPMFMDNGDRDICRNVREYIPRQMCNDYYVSRSHLTIISVMVIMGDGHSLCVNKLFSFKGGGKETNKDSLSNGE